MHIGLLVFIVFMVVVLQILQTVGKRASGRNFDPSVDSSGRPDHEGKKSPRHSPLFSGLQNHGLNRIWMQAAGNYDLAFIRPGEEGIYPGIGGESGDLLVRAFVDEGDQDSPPSTVIEIKYKEKLPVSFLLMQSEPTFLAEVMTGKKRLEKLAGLLAASREDFALTGNDPKTLEKLFSPAARNILEELLETGAYLKMDEEGICWSDPGVIDDEETLSEILGLLIAAGSIFYDAGKGLPPSASPVPAFSPAPVVLETPAPASIAREVAPEIVKEEAAPEMAASPEPEKKEIVEMPPEKMEEEKAAQAMPIGETPAAESASQAPEVEKRVVAPPEEVTLFQLGEELFAVPFPDAAIRKKWDEKKGTLFRGEGNIKASYDYRSDFVFGSTPGVKVTLDLGKIPGKEGRMDVPYRAVISFPAEEKEFFRTSQGGKIAFTGKLLKIETFAKEIYLTEGTISGKEGNI